MAAERVNMARLQALVDIAAGRRADEQGEILRHSEQAHNFGMAHAGYRVGNRTGEVQNVSGFGSLSNIAVEAQSQDSVTLVGDCSEAAVDFRGWLMYERAVERNRMEPAPPQYAVLPGAGSAFVSSPYPEDIPQTIEDRDLIDEQQSVGHRQLPQAEDLKIVTQGDGNRFYTRATGSMSNVRGQRSTTTCTNNGSQQPIAPGRAQHSSERKQG